MGTFLPQFATGVQHLDTLIFKLLNLIGFSSQIISFCLYQTLRLDYENMRTSLPSRKTLSFLRSSALWSGKWKQGLLHLDIWTTHQLKRLNIWTIEHLNNLRGQICDGKRQWVSECNRAVKCLKLLLRVQLIFSKWKYNYKWKYSQMQATFITGLTNLQQIKMKIQKMPSNAKCCFPTSAFNGKCLFA